MAEEWFVRRRRLPHVDVLGKPYFITGVLKGSIPASGLAEIRRFQEQLDSQPKPKGLKQTEWELKKHKLVFAFIDHRLDHQPAVCHLANERCADVVADAFRFFADERYRLFAFVVMPSHHHWLFLPIEKYFNRQQALTSNKRTPREQISHSVQSYTSNQCNQILGTSGTFWLDETYDHFSRDEDELFRIIEYIEQNPVKAGLVDNAEDWPWSSAFVRQQLNLTKFDTIPPKKNRPLPR